MITGFNSDIEFNGTVYHVQTEDKGVDSPLILTLVYVGGAILASKRVLYDDLLEKGFNEAELSERLSRQHKLICAAIMSGRIDELKEMSRRDAEARAAQTVRPPAASASPSIDPQLEPVPVEIVDERVEAPLISAPETRELPKIDAQPMDPEAELPIVEPEVFPDSEPTNYFSEPPDPVASPPVYIPPAQPLPRSPQSAAQGVGYAGLFDKVNLSQDEFPPDKPSIELINEVAYKAGEAVTLNIALRGSFDEGSKGLAHAPVGVKILGTNFRPIILSSRTDREGIASVTVMLPLFTSGRAAILIRAVVGGQTVEMRRMIHHG